MEFGTMFSSYDNERKMSPEELVRAVRQLVAAEWEAVQMYGQILNGCNSVVARSVLESIIEEEKVHAGEFLALLYTLCPDDQDKMMEGMEEAKGLIKKAK